MCCSRCRPCACVAAPSHWRLHAHPSSLWAAAGVGWEVRRCCCSSCGRLCWDAVRRRACWCGRVWARGREGVRLLPLWRRVRGIAAYPKGYVVCGAAGCAGCEACTRALHSALAPTLTWGKPRRAPARPAFPPAVHQGPFLSVPKRASGPAAHTLKFCFLATHRHATRRVHSSNDGACTGGRRRWESVCGSGGVHGGRACTMHAPTVATSHALTATRRRRRPPTH